MFCVGVVGYSIIGGERYSLVDAVYMTRPQTERFRDAQLDELLVRGTEPRKASLID